MWRAPVGGLAPARASGRPGATAAGCGGNSRVDGARLHPFAGNRAGLADVLHTGPSGFSLLKRRAGLAGMPSMRRCAARTPTCGFSAPQQRPQTLWFILMEQLGRLQVLALPPSLTDQHLTQSQSHEHRHGHRRRDVPSRWWTTAAAYRAWPGMRSMNGGLGGRRQCADGAGQAENDGEPGPTQGIEDIPSPSQTSAI